MIPEGYKMQTTFLMDFKIANAFGKKAVIDTYKRSMRDWKNNVLYMKELCLTLNIYCWDFYHLGNAEMNELYADLYHKCYDRCIKHFKGEELTDFWSFLD